MHVASIIGSPIIETRSAGLEQSARLQKAVESTEPKCIVLNFSGITHVSATSFGLVVLPAMRTMPETERYVLLASVPEYLVDQADRALAAESAAAWLGALSSEGFRPSLPLGDLDDDLNALLHHAAHSAPYGASEARAAVPHLGQKAVEGRLAKLHERRVLHREKRSRLVRYCAPWKVHDVT